MQENVSSILAVLRGSSPNFSVMSFAIRPVVRIAIVLFAVQTLAMLTRAAMLISAPLFPLMRLVRVLTRKSIPPLCLIISSIPPDSIVTIIRSPIPAMPFPMLSSQPTQLRHPVLNPITALMAIPRASTAVTLTPETASPMTAIYGISLIQSTVSPAGAMAAECPRTR